MYDYNKKKKTLYIRIYITHILPAYLTSISHIMDKLASTLMSFYRCFYIYICNIVCIHIIYLHDVYIYIYKIICTRV